MKQQDLFRKFNTHKKCLKHLELIRWGDNIKCTYCTSNKITHQPKERRYKCRECNKSFSVLVGTIFEATKLPLNKWFMAIYLIMDAKKGISSLQLSRHLNVNKDTAWFMQKRIRKAMDESDLVRGVMKLSENQIKTLTGNKKNSKGLHHVRKDVTSVGEEIENINGGEIFRTPIHFSESRFYHAFGFNVFSSNGFWLTLKRSILGTYHRVSDKYLQDYINEVAFKKLYSGSIHKHHTLLYNMIHFNSHFLGNEKIA